MRLIRRALTAATSSVLALIVGPAAAQGYPSEPVVLVVPNPPGGVVDTAARLLSEARAKLLEQTTGIDMTHLPYKGSGAAIQDVLAGQVHIFMSTPPPVMQHVQAGTPLAVVQQLTDNVKAALATPEANSAADGTGIEIRYLGPDALAALVQRETVCWDPVIRAKTINPD